MASSFHFESCEMVESFSEHPKVVVWMCSLKAGRIQG